MLLFLVKNSMLNKSKLYISIIPDMITIMKTVNPFVPDMQEVKK